MSHGSPILTMLTSSFPVVHKDKPTSLSPQSSNISMNTKNYKVIFKKNPKHVPSHL